MTQSSSSWAYPGNVLIIDDQYYENKEEKRGVVCDAVGSLIQSGVPVEYWNGKDERTFSGIRVVILDIVLSEDKAKEQDEYGDDYYDEAIQALQQIPGRPIVVPFSSQYTGDKLEELRNAFKTRTGEPFRGTFAEGLNKGELNDQGNLKGLIEKAIQDDDVIQLFLLWESLVDVAKDKTLEAILGKERSGTVENLISLLYEESGRSNSGLSREFIMTALRILSRFTYQGATFDAMKTKLLEINGKIIEKKEKEKKEKLEKGLGLVAEGEKEVWPFNSAPLSFIMYYSPGADRLWTGEIFKVRESPTDPSRQFAIVLTPMCDFARSKVEKVLACYGFKIGARELADVNHPVYRKVASLKDEIAKSNAHSVQEEIPGKLAKITKKVTTTYLDAEGALIPPRFYRLANYFIGKEEEENRSMLCFDFQDIESISEFNLDEGKVKNWDRENRLDSPYVDQMMREFGAYLSRLGVLGINTPLESIRK